MTTSTGTDTNKSKNIRRDEFDAVAMTDHLSRYFRDLGEHALLTPEQEIQFARDIETLEIQTWRILLGNPSITDYVLDIAIDRLATSKNTGLADDDVRPLRQAAMSVRQSRSANCCEILDTEARRIAELLRKSDLDRQHIDAILSHLRELSIESSQTRQIKLPFSPRNQRFAQTFTQASDHDRRASQLRRDFVHANLRLVVTMARRYDRGGMPLADLIQEGNLGLMHAVSRFDHRRKLRFSTYACWWIRHAIGRALADKARTVRIPVHMLEAQSQLQRVQQKLASELGRKPTDDEIAGETKLPPARIRQMHQYLMGQPLSLDRPVHESDDRILGETLTDPLSEAISPADRMTARTLVDQVQLSIRDLSPIEADVIQQRFGLHDDRARTFREISDQYDLSRERIRQIQKTALRKLRLALVRSIDTSFSAMKRSAA